MVAPTLNLQRQTEIYTLLEVCSMEKKNILLLTTGGTIASVPGGEGLEPRRSDVMERELDQLRTYYNIAVEDVLCLDSSNITPHQWQHIARTVF